jgi:hypothetical protein
MIDKIIYKDDMIALIIQASYNEAGINFFTPSDFSQQIAYMNRPRGYAIQPHVHNPVLREVQLTQEVLYIKSGRVRIDFFNQSKEYLESRIVHQGDVVLLASGGHGFEMLADSEIIEVKQGPYAGDQDKTRFDSELPEKLKLGK